VAKDRAPRFARSRSFDRLEKPARGILDTGTKTVAVRAPNLLSMYGYGYPEQLIPRPPSGGPCVMKKVEAFVRHEAFEPIRMELLTLGFPSLSITEVKGSGRQKGITERYRGAELTNYLRPKVKIECVVASGDVQSVVDTILKHARTGSIGDGKVFVLPVDDAYRIRTGESGEETLQAHPGTGTGTEPERVA
jgi:nitrogen regulatory protein P-II 1